MALHRIPQEIGADDTETGIPDLDQLISMARREMHVHAKPAGNGPVAEEAGKTAGRPLRRDASGPQRRQHQADKQGEEQTTTRGHG